MSRHQSGDDERDTARRMMSMDEMKSVVGKVHQPLTL